MNATWDVKHAIISGGASGIGLALAKALAGDDANISVLDLNIPEEKKQEITTQSRSDQQKILTFAVDITDAAAVRVAVNEAVAELGAPDFAINCAGINVAANFEQITDQQYFQVINVNLIGSRNFAVAVLPAMQAGAQLAFLASMGGLVANYAYSAYAASKFGVVGLANVLRTEYAPLGIGISAVCPPEVPTPMVEQEMENMHPASRALKDGAGLVELEELVPYVLENALRKKKFMVIPGMRARLMYGLSRLVPSSWFHAYADRIVRNVFAEHPEAARR
ncbi:MAG: SDR family NAD(P)-dependent oxidoreductase, partial [Pseudomonadales bacterium]